MKIPLTAPQEEFVFFDGDYPAMCGGLGSGKSEAGIMRLIILMMQNYQISTEPINTLLTFPTYDLCKLRGITGVEEVCLRLGLEFTTNKSDYRTDINGFGSILYRSYDRPERIVAFECAHSICDELDTLPKEKAELVWRKINERTRQMNYRFNSDGVVISTNTIGAVTTPDQGVLGFCYDKWVKRRAKGYGLIKAPTHTNPYLPDGYIEQIKANYDPLLADVYVMGEFLSLNDKKVYHFFDRNIHHSDRVVEKDDILHIGIDFNVGGCCSPVCVIDGNKPVAVDEFISHDTYDFINNLTKYKDHKIRVYPDASGDNDSTNATASDISMIRNAGYVVDAPKKNPFIRDRVNAVNALLAHERMLVNTDKCPNLTDALEMQGYDKSNKPEKFNTHPAIDDWNDSLGYFINKKFPIIKPITNIGFRMNY